MAIIADMRRTTNVSIADGKNRFPELIRAVEDGEEITITRHGRPVARIAPLRRSKARLGGMKDRIRLLPGWNSPIDPDRFLEGEL